MQPRTSTTDWSVLDCIEITPRLRQLIKDQDWNEANQSQLQRLLSEEIPGRLARIRSHYQQFPILKEEFRKLHSELAFDELIGHIPGSNDFKECLLHSVHFDDQYHHTVVVRFQYSLFMLTLAAADTSAEGVELSQGLLLESNISSADFTGDYDSMVSHFVAFGQRIHGSESADLANLCSWVPGVIKTLSRGCPGILERVMFALHRSSRSEHAFKLFEMYTQSFASSDTPTSANTLKTAKTWIGYYKASTSSTFEGRIVRHEFSSFLEMITRYSRLARTSIGQNDQTHITLPEVDSLLDHFFHWDEHGLLEMDWLEVLSIAANSKSVQGLMIEWIRSLHRREQLGILRDSIVFESQRWSPETSTSGSWWRLPYYFARTNLFTSLINYIHSTANSNIAGELLTGIVRVDRDWFAIGDAIRHGEERLGAVAFGSLLNAIAHELFLAGDYAEVIRFIEASLGITGNANYGSDEFNSRISTLCAIDQNRSDELVALLSVLLFALTKEGHLDCAQCVCIGIFGARPGFADFNYHRLNRIKEASPNLWKLLLGSLLTLNLVADATVHSGAFIEQATGALTFGDTGSSHSYFSQLVDRFGKKLGLLEVEILGQIAIALSQKNGPEFGFEFGKLLVAAVEHQSESREVFLAEDDSLRLVSIFYLAGLIDDTSQKAAFVEFLQSSASTRAVLNLEFLASHRRWNIGLEPLVRREYVPMVAHHVLESLVASGRVEEAARLVQTQIPDFGWVDDEDSPYAIVAGLYLALSCAHLLKEHDHGAAVSLYRQCTRCLRSAARSDAMSGPNKVRHAQRIADLRRTFSAIGHTLLSSSEENVEWLYIRQLEVDAAISNNVLMFRYLQGKPRVSIDEGLPMQKGRRFMRSVESRFAAKNLQQTLCLDTRSTCPDSVAGTVQRVCSEFDEDGDRRYSERSRWFNTSEFVGAQCRDQHKLLRGCFTTSGSVAWSLFSIESGVLKLEGSHVTPKSAVKEQLRLLLSNFYFQNSLVWDLYDLGENGMHLFESLAHLCDRKEPASVSIKPVARFFDRNRALLPRSTHQLECVFGDVSTWGSRQDAERWNTFWSRVFELRSILNPANGVCLEVTLDNVTENLINLAGLELCLDWLPGILDDRSDLAIWVEDELLEVPIEFIRPSGGEKYLFEYVGSVRNTVTPWLDHEMLAREQVIKWESLPPLVLSLSSFESNSDSEICIEWELMKHYRAIEEKFDGVFEWRTANSLLKTKGGHDVLGRTLHECKEQRVAVLTVCGHGHSDPSGVRLADGIWDGSEVWSVDPDRPNSWLVRGGTDLSRIDFLVQVSCSIGQPSQDGSRDVMGFCVELFINRARAILAGRWELHAGHSLEHTTAVVTRYLDRYSEISKSAGDLSPELPRARAVSDARKTWAVERRQGETAIGLNTVAAMALYGLG